MTAITTALNHVTAAVPAVCPIPPPGLAVYADQVAGWVKWGVVILVGLAGLVSIGAILVGRLFSHPHASRMGAMGLAGVIMCAILVVTIPGLLDAIVGSGC